MGKAATQIPEIAPARSEAGIVALIDDDAAVRRGIQRVLQAMGFTVASFVTAEEFLACRKGSDFCILVCDVNLPGMSGVELCGRMTEAGDRLPVILISSDAPAPAVIRRSSGGAVCLLSKPLDAELLELALAAHQLGRIAERP